MPDRPAAADHGAVGYRDEMTDEQLVGKHVDGPSGLVFDTEEAYLNHVNPLSGHKPTELEHLEGTTTPGARAIANEALNRGDARREEPEHPAEAQAKQAGEPVNAPAPQE